MLNQDQQYYETVKKFVVFLSERNLFDPFIYNMAQRKLKNDGSRYCDNELRGMAVLYKSCKDFTDQQANYLKQQFESLDLTPTCLPTRDTYTRNQMAQQALMKDYWDSVAKGRSTE
jgi:hypothetical protein